MEFLTHRNDLDLTLSDNTELLGEMTKFEPKLNIPMDFLFVLHQSHNCLEVISIFSDSTGQSSSKGVKMKRLYLSYSHLLSKIDWQGIHRAMNELREAAFRHQRDYDSKDVMKKLAADMVSQYIVARIQLCVSNPNFELRVVPLFSDDKNIDFVIEKPPTLIPASIQFRSPLKKR